MDLSRTSTARRHLRLMLDAAIAAAQPHRCLPPHLPQPLPNGRIVVVGAGKAAGSMAQVAERHYGQIGAGDRLLGAVTTRYGYALPTQRIVVREAAHPVPDDASVAAAEEALRIAEQVTPDDLLLVLLSGGASALWAAPCVGLLLAEKQAVTRQLLRSGAPIEEMNTVRKHLSRIKGGRLARTGAKAERVVTLAISDVIGDDPATIGSGPTVADPTTLDEASAILARRGIDPGPAATAALHAAANESPKPGEPCFARGTFTIIAAARQSLQAAREKAAMLGYRVDSLGEAVEGEARDVARVHAARAIEARARGERVLLLSGGELTVTLKGSGVGGRNQEYALALAMALDGAPGVTALAAGTDGADGGRGAADDPAGAVVDDTTLDRARGLDLNSAMFLENNNSGGYFSRLGDLIVTGPTQTNVNDFRAILVDP